MSVSADIMTDRSKGEIKDDLSEPVTIGVDAYLYFYPLVTMDLNSQAVIERRAWEGVWWPNEHVYQRSGVSDRRRSSGGSSQLRHALLLRLA